MASSPVMCSTAQPCLEVSLSPRAPVGNRCNTSTNCFTRDTTPPMSIVAPSNPSLCNDNPSVAPTGIPVKKMRMLPPQGPVPESTKPHLPHATTGQAPELFECEDARHRAPTNELDDATVGHGCTRKSRTHTRPGLLRCVVSLGEEGYINVDNTMLGEGAQSKVFRYRSSTGHPVAIKFISKARGHTSSRRNPSSSLASYSWTLHSTGGTVSSVTSSMPRAPDSLNSPISEQESCALNPTDTVVAAAPMQVDKVRHKDRRPLVEVLCLERLRDHPSVVQCLDAVQTEHEVCIITEEFGIDLDHWLRHVKSHLSDSHLPPNRGLSGDAYLECVRNATRQLVRVMYDLHYTATIAHRDIKLQNVLMHQGQIKLIDFGSAALCVRNEKDVVISVKGTLGYMAPELLECAANERLFRTDCEGLYKTDTFALGVLVYYLVYGRAPFRVNDIIDVLPPMHVVPEKAKRFQLSATEMLQRMTRPPTMYPRSLGCSVISSDLKSFLKGLLELSPEKRWDISTARNAAWLSDAWIVDS